MCGEGCAWGGVCVGRGVCGEGCAWGGVCVGEEGITLHEGYSILASSPKFKV